jgi:hypothetical protein
MISVLYFNAEGIPPRASVSSARPDKCEHQIRWSADWKASTGMAVAGVAGGAVRAVVGQRRRGHLQPCGRRRRVGAAFSLPSTLIPCQTLTLPGGPVASANPTAASTAPSPAVSTMASTCAITRSPPGLRGSPRHNCVSS